MTSSPGSTRASMVNSSTFFEPGTITTCSGLTSTSYQRRIQSATACLAGIKPPAGV